MNNKAFTLIELLVAVTILALLALMMTNITSMISQMTKLSNRNVDATAQARLAFDRLGMDLASAIVRPDVDFSANYLPADARTDFLQFISSVSSADPTSPPPGFANRNLSLIGYRIAPSPDNANLPCLLRTGRAFSWSDRNFMGLGTTGYPPLLADLTQSSGPFPLLDTEYDVLAPAVIRAIVGFQLHPDNNPVVLLDGTNLANARGQIVYSPPVRDTAVPGKSYTDTKRISALIVAFVVIDPRSLKLLSSANVATLAKAFTDTTAPAQNQLPVAKWMADTSDLTNLPASIPMPVKQSIRLFQRSYPITPYGSQTP